MSPVAQTAGTVPSSPREPGERLVRPALLLAGILLLAANMRAPITVVSPLLGTISEELALSSATASVLISLPLLCFAAFSPLVPRLARRWGIEGTLVAALMLLCLAIVVRSLPWTPGLWLGTAGIGASVSAINVLLPSLLKRDFPTRIGPMTGVYNAVQSTFAAAASGLAVPLAGLPGWSWRTAIGITLGFALVGLAVMLPILRAALAGRAARRALTTDPLPDGVGPGSTAGGATAPLAAGTTSDAAGAPAPPRPSTPVWRSTIAWQVTAFMGVQSTLFYSMLTWWPSIERDAGLDPVTAGVHMALLQLSSIGGNLLTGALLRRVDARWVTMLPQPLIIIAFVGMLTAPDAALLWSVCFGFAAGNNIVAALSLFGARTRSHQSAAAVSGMGQSVGYLAAAVVPAALGVLHDATGSWTPVLWVLCGLAALTALLGWFAAGKRQLD
ncbi:MFS transporter [Galactobacter valiniphilus]|uniref:MFS transporter n=1 Tax=Galactobacter valiniphilus TaxID=2676122 RepID=A0A399JBQ7_9MICC|nr:MFS transporter [Galactobacter valiniphilus]RII41472.1 MFS transporter [Galactobacter valiniphilus]